MLGKTLENLHPQANDGTSETLGTLLRQERRSRRLSQEQVALKAGVARATLNRWEQDAHLPRLAELQAVLGALDASPEFRTQMLTLLPAPRAIQTLRAEQSHLPSIEGKDKTGAADSQENSWVFTPETGDLLRTMRLRQGMTQEFVADKLRVRRASVSRWENGDVIPSDAHLDEMMILLGALPEERTALARGLLVPSCLTMDTSRSFLAVREHYDQIIWSESDSRIEPLKDLEFLRVERAFADLIPYHPEARDFLVYAYSFHSQWLVRKKRFKEAAIYADRVIEAAHRQVFSLFDWQRSIMTAAECAVNSGANPRPERGVEILRDWLPLVDDPPYKAWLLSDMAKYLAQSGQLDPALDTMVRSCRVAQRCENRAELRYRRVDRAELLLRTGSTENASQALDLLPVGTAYDPLERVREAMLWSKGLRLVNEASDAGIWQERANEIVQASHLDPATVRSLVERL